MHLILLVIITAAFLTSTGYCATIANSPHDFRPTTTTGSEQVCIYCHASHDVTRYKSLWSSDPSVFKLYSAVNGASRTFSSGFTADSESLYCLACHEATSHSLPINYPTGDAKLGTDLSKVHPVNFQVTSIDTQKDLWVEGGSYTGNQMGRYGGKPYPLFIINGTGGRSGSRALECGSCHNAHSTEFSPFLRDTMTRSQLCLGCHNK